MRRERIRKSELIQQTQRLNSTGNLSLTRSVKVDNILTRAQAVMDERLDDVKTMNAMMLYCRVAAIRDK